MQTLIIMEDGTNDLIRIRSYAEKNPFSINDLLDIINNPSLSPGLNPLYQCHIPIGFKIVFSIEETAEWGYARRLSISLCKKGQIPNPEICLEIMKILGFKSSLSECLVSIEKLEPGYSAIDIGELIILQNS